MKEGNRGEEREGLGEGEEGKWGMGKGGEKWEVWGNSTLIVGGYTALYISELLINVVCVKGELRSWLARMEKYDSIPSLGEQQMSARVFTCLVIFAEVIRCSHTYRVLMVYLVKACVCMCNYPVTLQSANIVVMAARQLCRPFCFTAVV